MNDRNETAVRYLFFKRYSQRKMVQKTTFQEIQKKPFSDQRTGDLNFNYSNFELKL